MLLDLAVLSAVSRDDIIESLCCNVTRWGCLPREIALTLQENVWKDVTRQTIHRWLIELSAPSSQQAKDLQDDVLAITHKSGRLMLSHSDVDDRNLNKLRLLVDKEWKLKRGTSRRGLAKKLGVDVSKIDEYLAELKTSLAHIGPETCELEDATDGDAPSLFDENINGSRRARRQAKELHAAELVILSLQGLL